MRFNGILKNKGLLIGIFLFIVIAFMVFYFFYQTTTLQISQDNIDKIVWRDIYFKQHVMIDNDEIETLIHFLNSVTLSDDYMFPDYMLPSVIIEVKYKDGHTITIDYAYSSLLYMDKRYGVNDNRAGELFEILELPSFTFEK